MLGSKEEPYPGHVLIICWCEYDNKKLYFLCSRILAGISAHFGYYQNLVI